MVSQMPSFTSWDAAVAAGERAFRMAGVRHAEIDVAGISADAFTIVPILALEALVVSARPAKAVRSWPDSAPRRAGHFR